MKANIATEAQEQTALFDWARWASGKHPELNLLFHIPNGGSRNEIEAHNLRLQGVRPGVPDICLPVPRLPYHGLFIELKRRQGGRTSEEQRAWIYCLNKNGYRAVVCKGWDETRAEIERYLGHGSVERG